jgi:hypothetical protein
MFKQLLRNKRRKIFSIKKEPKRKMLANKALWLIGIVCFISFRGEIVLHSSNK